MLAALLLADARTPLGGHTHSGGVEAVVRNGTLTGVEDLETFLRARIRTAGLVGAAFAAARGFAIGELDAEFGARTPSPALRAASRAQGAALRRTGSRMWPAPEWDILRRPHLPIALGIAAGASGLEQAQAAELSVHHLIGGACSAAIRLLGLDPLAVAALSAGLAPLAEQTAEAGVSAANTARTPAELPSASTPCPDVLAQLHEQSEVSLFAS
ncbi:urease accessory protein UreF [Sciscionella sediminilitoris]|uniref:urease accessory protein UreF n=1 Tax=Sciscionella sediminilitoris TaxID=1445613 RepID=UPI0004DFBE13|nr:urease accessory UreF family protein [Sciscionella sp. SE31]